MRNTLKRALSVALAGLMLTSAATVATVGVSANSGEKTRITFEEACERQWYDQLGEGDKEAGKAALKTIKYMFYMPDEWKNEFNDYYDGKDPSTYAAGIYWWDTTATPDACNLMTKKGWPGYAVTEKAADCDNVFIANVPTDASAIIWNNLVDGGEDPEAEEYDKAIQSCNIEVGGYGPGMDVYGFYPDGLPTMENMIFVCNPADTTTSPSSGKLSYVGEWFYYYGNGEYGFAPTREEAGKNIYSDGVFPPTGLVMSKTEFKVGIGGTETATANKGNTTAKSDDESIATVTKGENGKFTVTGVAAGKTTITFESYNEKTYETNTYKAPVTVVAPSFDTTKITMNAGGIFDNIGYGIGENAVISYSTKGIVSYDGYAVTAKKAGTVTVYCKQGGKTYSFKVTVKPGLNATSKKLKAGQTFTLKAKGGSAKFTTSNKKIATVSSKGVVTALKKGTVTITVKVNGQTNKAKITVSSNPSIKSSVTAKLKKTTNLKITGAASKSNVKVSKCKIAKITVSKTKLAIKGTKKGKQTLTVKINGVTKKVKLTVK